MLQLVLTQNETNRLVIKHLQLYQDFLIKFNISLKEQNGRACYVFEQKVMPIFGAMMSVSFFWPPVFRSLICREIRSFTKSFLVYFHPQIVLSTDLMNPLTNNKFRSNYTYKFI